MGRRRKPDPDAREAAQDRRYVSALARGLAVGTRLQLANTVMGRYSG